MHLKSSLAVAALSISLGLASSGARAAVTYDFTALSSFDFNGESFAGSFSVTLPGFITSRTNVPFADLTSCSVIDSGGPATCLAQDFLYGVTPGTETVGFHIESAANPGTEIYYYFDAGSFETPGTYTSVVLGTSQEGTLTVMRTSAVPEPGTLSMLVAGVGFLAVASRRKKTATRAG